MPLGLGQTHDDIETPVTLEYLSGNRTAHRDADRILHVGDRQTISGQGHAVWQNGHQRQTGDLLQLDVGRAGHAIGDRFDLSAQRGQGFEVIAVDLDRHFGADAGDQLVHAHLHRLGELVLVAGNGVDRSIHLADQVLLRLARVWPVGAVLEHDERIGYRGRHRVGGDLGGADLADDHVHFWKLLDACLQLLLHVDRLGQAGSRDA